MSGPSVKIPADWLDSDHIEDLGADVVLLMLTALGHSARQLTEGIVPRRALRKLWPVDDIEGAVSRLVDAGELEDRGDQLLFVNWEQFILTREYVEEVREDAKVRDRRRNRHNRGDHSCCLPRYCSDAPRGNTRENTRGLLVSPRVGHEGPTRPDPTRPLGRGEEEGEGGEAAAGGSAGAPPTTTTLPPIKTIRVNQLIGDDYTGPNAKHVEITVGIDHPDPYQLRHAWPLAERVLDQTRADLEPTLASTKETCECWDGDWENCCATPAVVPASENEDQGPELGVTIPASEFTRWERAINSALKNAIALTTTWANGGGAA